MRRTVAVLALGSLILAACGGSDEPTAQPAPDPAAEAPAADEPAEVEPASEEPASEESSTAEPADEAVEPDAEPAEDAPPSSVVEAAPGDSDSEPEPSGDAELDEPAPEPAEEPAPEPAAVWPDDGCSPDNAPTPVAAADGPAPVVEIRAESVASPLPDLAVRRINCKGGWENLRNELPSERPLLVWFWAPH